MGTTGDERAHAERVRILSVAAERSDAERVAAALEREDERFETSTATSAREGLDRSETSRIDCIVSENELPGIDGLTFLKRVRERDENLPFILVPQSGSESLASEAISTGVTDYVRMGAGDESEQFTLLANRIATAVETTHARRQRQRHLRAIETAQEGIGLLDADGRFIYVNQSYADCFGYEPDELLGERWEILYDDDEAAFIRDEVIPTLREAGDWRGESSGIRADGSGIVIDHTLSTTDHGELICTVRDISDRKERKRDLERYETIIEALGDPVYTVDADGVIAFVNDAYAEMTGYDKDEIIGEPVSFLLDETAVERAEETVRTLLSEENDATQRTYEIGVEARDGTAIQCEDNISLLPLKDGEYRGAAGVVRDITERKERERELEQYETILETIPDEVYALDADGRFTKIVPPTDSERTISGYEPQELIGEHVSEVLDEDAIERGESKIRELLRDDDRTKVSFEIGVHTRSGDCIPNENHVALLPTGDDSAFRGTVGVLRDITERRERERELKRKNERLESFASVVSHDLRNPLNVAQGQLELARQSDPPDAERLEAVAQSHERIQTLIEDILTLAREDEPVTDTEPVDLATIAGVCWQHVDTDGAALNAATDAAIQVDRSRFKRLLENLIRNAVEHGSTSPASQAQQDAGRRAASSEPSVADAPEDAVEHGSTSSRPRADDAVKHGSTERDARPDGDRETGGVTVTIGDLEDGAGFYLEDDGPGIPPEKRDRVLESGFSTAEAGTGFGLAIVEEIADAHGWSVTVTEGEDGGARFEFRNVDVRR